MAAQSNADSAALIWPEQQISLEIACHTRLIQGSPGDWVARFSRSNHWSTASAPQPDHRIDDGHRAVQMVGTDRPTDP